jgi:hypothetical protein
MQVVKDLLNTAYQDTELLRSLDTNGDVFSRPRDVDFLLKAPSKEKADVVSSFVNDNSYGSATVQGATTTGAFSSRSACRLSKTFSIACQG